MKWIKMDDDGIAVLKESKSSSASVAADAKGVTLGPEGLQTSND